MGAISAAPPGKEGPTQKPLKSSYFPGEEAEPPTVDRQDAGVPEKGQEAGRLSSPEWGRWVGWAGVGSLVRGAVLKIT